MISQITARSWITIYLSEQGPQGEPGDPGQPAEFYDLMTLSEKAFVLIDNENPNGKLVVQLQYNIRHITGNTTEIVNSTSSGYHIRFRRNDATTFYYLSNNTNSPSYTNTNFLPNFHIQTSQPEYLIIQLCYGSSHTLVNTRIVPVTFNADLLFDINTSLNTITSTVQGHSSNIEELLNRSIGGRNFVRNTSDQWSEWISLTNKSNQAIDLGYCYLPADKEVGDEYTSQITIEYSSVQTGSGTFSMAAQASVDNSWSIPSIWNNQLISYNTPPEDGVCKYVHTYQIQESNKNALYMRLMLRADYALGSLRYKCVKIEKGNTATDWSKNPDDIDSSILTVTNSMSQIQQTMNSISSTVNTHTTNINNLNSQISTIQNDVTRIEQKADSITSSVEKLFIETLFDDQIYGGTFFSLSDGESSQSVSYNSTTNTYKMQCSSTAQDIDYTNNFVDYRIDKGKYQLSYNVHLSQPAVKYTCTITIRNSSNSILNNKTVVDNSYSSQTNDTMVVDSFEVPQDNCRFQLQFESVWNDKQTSSIWYVEISDLKIVMQTQAASILEQKADSITSTVYDHSRTLDALSDDSQNKFGRSVYNGGELSPGNKWEFVSQGLNYTFDNLTKYNAIFNNGSCDWETLANGVTYIYSPYLYLYKDQVYTLNLNYNYEDSKNSIGLVRFANETNAKNIVSPLSPKSLHTYPMYLETDQDVIQFTPTITGYYRIRFGNQVTSFNSDNSYVVELSNVRLYQGTFTASEFKYWPNNNSKVYTQIQQTGNSISLKVHDDLLSTGIDIESQKVTLTADNFIVNNNSNEQVLGTDRDGNLEIQGIIRAKSLYREVCFYVDGGIYHFPNDSGKKWYYCTDLSDMTDECELESWNDYLNFEEGKYYEWPNVNAPHFDSAPGGFIACTYDADIIMMLPRANATWRYNTAVNLPSPNDFPGKILKILTSRSVTSVSSGAAIKVGCVLPQKMALGFYASNTGETYSAVSIVDSITINPYYNIELMSINNTWIVMDITSKNYNITSN